MITSQLTYTAEVNWKMLTRGGFELTPLGYWSAALPVELEATGIGDEFLSNLSTWDILVTT